MAVTTWSVRARRAKPTSAGCALGHGSPMVPHGKCLHRLAKRKLAHLIPFSHHANIHADKLAGALGAVHDAGVVVNGIVTAKYAMLPSKFSTVQKKTKQIKHTYRVKMPMLFPVSIPQWFPP